MEFHLFGIKPYINIYIYKEYELMTVISVHWPRMIKDKGVGRKAILVVPFIGGQQMSKLLVNVWEGLHIKHLDC